MNELSRVLLPANMLLSSNPSFMNKNKSEEYSMANNITTTNNNSRKNKNMRNNNSNNKYTSS